MIFAFISSNVRLFLSSAHIFADKIDLRGCWRFEELYLFILDLFTQFLQ